MPEVIKTKVFGVSHKNEDGESRQKLIRKHLNDGDELLLQREPHNEYDSNAVAVWGYRDVDVDDYETDGDFKVGYLSGHIAEEVAPAMDAGQLVQASVLEVTGGEDGKSFGVNIAVFIHSPDETAEYARKRIAETEKQKASAVAAPAAPAVPIKPITAKTPSRSKRRGTLFKLIVLFVSLFFAWIFFSTIPSYQVNNDKGSILVAILLALISLTLAAWMAYLIFRPFIHKTIIERKS